MRLHVRCRKFPRVVSYAVLRYISAVLQEFRCSLCRSSEMFRRPLHASMVSEFSLEGFFGGGRWSVVLWIFGAITPAVDSQDDCPLGTVRSYDVRTDGFRAFATLPCQPDGITYDCSITYAADPSCTSMQTAISDFDVIAGQSITIRDGSSSPLKYYDGLNDAPILGAIVSYPTSTLILQFTSSFPCTGAKPKLSGYVTPAGCGPTTTTTTTTTTSTTSETTPDTTTTTSDVTSAAPLTTTEPAVAVVASPSPSSGASLEIPVTSILFCAIAIGGVLALALLWSYAAGATLTVFIFFALFIVVLFSRSSDPSSAAFLEQSPVPLLEP